MRWLSKLVFVGAVTCSMSVFVGCETSNDLRLASFSEATSAGSRDYVIRINFAEDDRVDEKYADIQVQMSKSGSLVFWEEGGTQKTLVFDQANAWYSLTTLMVKADGIPNTEKFTKYSEMLSKSYIINSREDVNLSFRVVVGEPEDNSRGTGKILTNTEEISSTFKLKVKKKG